jgi:hypothetical protein
MEGDIPALNIIATLSLLLFMVKLAYASLNFRSFETSPY